MNTQEVIQELNRELVTQQEAARIQVHKELAEMMRARAPKLFKRIRKDLAGGKSDPRSAVFKTIAERFIDNPTMLERMFLGRLASEHLRNILHAELVVVVNQRQTIPLYPEGIRPPLPRRSDLSRMLTRLCTRGRSKEHA